MKSFFKSELLFFDTFLGVPRLNLFITSEEVNCDSPDAIAFNKLSCVPLKFSQSLIYNGELVLINKSNAVVTSFFVAIFS